MKIKTIDWSFIVVNKELSTPVHVQITQCLLDAISNNIIPKGAKLLSPLEMAKLLNVQLDDIKNSFGKLISYGVIKIKSTTYIEDINGNKIQSDDKFYKNCSHTTGTSVIESESKVASLMENLSDIIHECIALDITRDDIIKSVVEGYDDCIKEGDKCQNTFKYNIPSDVDPDSVFKYGYEKTPLWFQAEIINSPRIISKDVNYFNDVKNAGLNGIDYCLNDNAHNLISLLKGDIICKDKLGYIRLYRGHDLNCAFISLKTPSTL